MVKVTTTWRNDNPNTIWNVLKAKLGREPTTAEAVAELDRIFAEARAERETASRGAASHGGA